MSPAWHPDGKHIVYVTFENKRSEIYIQNLYTQKRKKITGFQALMVRQNFLLMVAI